MGESGEEKLKYDWKKLIKSQKKALSVLCVVAIIAFIGFFLVFNWLITTSNLGAQGTWSIGDWALSTMVDFLFLCIVWELLLIGAPAAVFFGVFGYLWWTNLSDEVKDEFKALDKASKKKRRNNTTYQGSGGSFGMFLLICIMVAIDGNWTTTFGALPYSYFFYQWLLGMMWVGIIIGIPVTIAVLIWYFTKKKD